MNRPLSDNEDVVMEILLRLPVKSLYRFKTVNQSWNDIISSPIFRKLYVESRRALNLDADFLHKMTDDVSERCCPKICGPVKDLICIYGVYATQGIALFDLSLVKMEILEFPIPEMNYKGILRRNLGFGFSNRVNELIVVQLLSYVGTSIKSRGDLNIRVDLYSGNKKTWRKTGDAVDNMYIKKAIGSCKNGSFCHWLAEKSRRGAPYMFVVSYDFNRRCFRKTLLPLLFNDAAFDRKQEEVKIFVEDNTLVLFTYPILGNNYLLERWVLNDYGSNGEWTKLPPVGPLLQMSKPVAILENHGVLLKYGYDGRKCFVFYNYSTREIRNIEIPQKQKDHVKVIEYKGIPVSIGI